MNKHTVFVYLLLLCSWCSLNAQNIDLELSLSTPNLSPSNYSHVPLTYTINNNGTATATNIRVDVRVCDPLLDYPVVFNNPTQVVNSTSPPHATSAGTYDKVRHAWFIPSLAAGSSATLDLTIFILTEEERTILGAVSEVDQTDVDSSPEILESCNISEDDEAELLLNGGITPSCDIQNLAWVDVRLEDEEALCAQCIDFIKIYEVDDVLYVGFIADNENCPNALTTIYYCNGTAFCEDSGLTGLPECEDWWAQNPTESYELWRGHCFDNTGYGTIGAFAWVDYNGNGIREEGIDNGIEGMRVNLEDSNNNVVASALTTSYGQGFYYDVPAGIYRLAFEGLDGTVPTEKFAPGSADWSNSAINADGKTDFFTLDANQIINYVGGGFYDSSSSTTMDLELSLEVSNPNPSVYTHLPVTYTVENTGTGTANNIRIQVGACVEGFWLFSQSTGIVHSSTTPVTSAGAYSKTSQVWEISSLAPGTSATLDLSLFMLTDEERPLVGQIFDASPNDVDSSPQNMTTCTAAEDDEVSVLLNGNNTCICPAVIDPVCGSDGETYDNACLAECAGIFDYTSGECDLNICHEVCPTNIAPVCGSDGVTYDNACLAECVGIFDYTSGECTTGGDGVDLELEIIPPSSYAIYTNMTFQVRVFNNGTTNAENVVVDAPLPEGFVHSSNSASAGDYDLFREKWNVGTIKVGETAVLDLNLFALTSDDITAYAQVAEAEPTDIDSTPGNGACCTSNEDDEDAITISTNLQGGNNSNAFIAPSNNRDINIKTMYPNIATDKINLFVDSKLPELNVRIYNMQGHELIQQKHQNTEGLNRLQLDVSELPTGTYFIRLDGTLGRETLRFVKMRM